MKNFWLAACIALIQLGPRSTADAVTYDQEYYEYFFASKLADILNVVQAGSGQALWFTNLMQIASVMPAQSLADYEEKFLTYGGKAGFTNSLLEKYILLPSPRLKGPRPDYSDIMLIAATPLKKKTGKVERIFVSKYRNRFGAGWIEENQFQESLRDAGIRLSELPRPAPMPSLRYLNDPTGELAARMRDMEEEHVKGVAEWNRRHAPPFWQRPHWQFAGLLLAVVLIVVVSWRAGRRSPRDDSA